MAKIVKVRAISAVVQKVFNIIEKDRKSALTVGDKVDTEVRAAWSVMPEYGTYTDALKDIDALCKKRGLSDATTYHAKAFRASITRVYGACPVAMTKGSRDKDHERVKAIGDDAWKEYETVRAANVDKPAHVAESLAIAAAKAKKSKPVQDTAGAPSKEPKPQSKTLREQFAQLLAIDGSKSHLMAIDVLCEALRADKSTLAYAKPLNDIAKKLATLWHVSDATPAPETAEKTGTQG